MIDVYVSGSTIDAGRQGENLARNIIFELQSLIDAYGEGTATLVCMRPSDKAPYVCETTQDDAVLTWQPTSTDTAYAGSGKCELRWVVGETLAKSIIYTTTIAPSITGAEGVPDAYRSWYDAMMDYIKNNYSESGAPQEVREAIYTLLSKAAYTETGLTDELATVQAWAAEHFTITNNLTNVTTNNNTGIVVSGSSYTATLAAVSGYTLVTVSVTMGGEDVTATVYSSGTITIPSVTGNIVITATAIPAAASRTITNVLTNITSSNPATVVSDGSAYTATLTGATGYDYDAFSVSVTMGGVDVTSSVYSGGVISIPSVTGDVVITANTGSTLSIAQGTKSFTTGCKYTVSASGRLGHITLSGNTGQNDAFTSYTNVSAMTTKSNDMANENNGGVALMTLPANTTIRVECEFESVSVTDKSGYASAINVHVWGNGTTAAALISQYAVGNIADIVTGELYYKEFTLETATDLHSIGLYLDTNYASAMDITYRMRMWVGGTRYI